MNNERHESARSLACNPSVLSHHRNRLGMTQRELAKASGYTERLINKAEAGLPISVQTIHDLAETLSREGVKVTPGDLTCDPLSLAREYIAAMYSRADNVFDRIKHFLHDDVVFWIAGDPEKIPFAGEHRGITAVERAIGLFFSVLEAPVDHSFEDHYQFQARGNEVMLFGKSWIHPIGRPLSEPIAVSHRLLFSDGLLIRMEDVFDTLAGAEALDL